jgi:hypothetical protein
MRPKVAPNRATIIGGCLTFVAAVALAFLVFFASEFHSTLALIALVAFQLCFIWTCAELLDSTTEDASDDVDPSEGKFSR